MSDTNKKKYFDFDFDINNNWSPSSIGSFHGVAAKNINWIAAIDAWDFCDPEPLSGMINNCEIPQELRPIISSIISAERMQNRIGAKKLRIPAKARLMVAVCLIELRAIPEAALAGNFIPNYTEVANKEGLEVSEVIKRYREDLRELDSSFMDSTGLSKSSIKNLIRDLKNKLEKYPEI